MIKLSNYSDHPSLVGKQLYCTKDTSVVDAYLKKVQLHIKEVQIAGYSLMDTPLNLEYSFTIFKQNLFDHDLSKFSPEEVFGYAFYNFGGENSLSEICDFEMAWFHHKQNNKHHSEYWLNPNRSGVCEPFPMPDIYIAEMIADWMGASTVYGTEMQTWLNKNYSKFLLHPSTKDKLSESLTILGYTI